MTAICKFSAAALLMAIGLQACTLETEVYDDINPSIYPTTERDAEDMVTASLYGAFRNNGYNGLFNAATGVQTSTDMASDYGLCSWDDGGGWMRLASASYGATGDSRNVTNFWRDYTNYISKMTLTIDRISGMNIDESLKTRLIAELHCGRGFLAFVLYDLYGPIILADLETLKNPQEEKILPRQTDEATRTFIVEELTEAAKNLPHSYKRGDVGYGRFTKGLCHMVLLKFYMQTAQWDMAEKEGRELMKPEYGYGLVPEYKDIFTEANEKNEETVWAVNCKHGFQTHKWFPHAMTNNYPGYTGGWGGYKMTWKFFKTFEAGDKRRETIIYEYVTLEGDTLNEKNKGKEGNSLAQGVLPMKYDVATANLVGENCQIDWIVYRYADVITLLAEAIVRKGNTVTGEAVSLLNRVRTRAGLNAYAENSFSGARDFLNKLLDERGHEFYFEGCRRQDLIRDGSYVAKMNEKRTDLGWATPVVTNDRILFPLQESAIIEGKGIVKQNPGY
ncbi:MAG: RagB/SusD family nutrient uptake outer membrane protein [Prevotellaceae bacterium]|nr:RagB/SusD family nutrient uptake outer membrane protein [Prevotellaceae bacterium]